MVVQAKYETGIFSVAQGVKGETDNNGRPINLLDLLSLEVPVFAGWAGIATYGVCGFPSPNAFFPVPESLKRPMIYSSGTNTFQDSAICMYPSATPTAVSTFPYPSAIQHTWRNSQ
jgi:hypothetical protein